MPACHTSSNSILLWKNPIRSAVVLAQLLAGIAVITCAQPLRFVLRSSVWTLFGLAAIEQLSRYYSGRPSEPGLVSSYRPSRFIDLSDAQREKIANKISSSIHFALAHFHSALDAKDPRYTASVAGSLLAVYILTSFFSFAALLYMAVIGAFTIPKLYTMYQKEIDQVLEKIKGHAADQYKNVHSQVMRHAGPHIETAKKQVGGIANKVGYNRGFPATPKATTTSSAPSATTATTTTTSPSTGTTFPTTKGEVDTTDFAKNASSAASDLRAGISSAISEQSATEPTVEEKKLVEGISSSYDSVPTMIGTVSLDPTHSSKPLETGKFKESNLDLE